MNGAWVSAREAREIVSQGWQDEGKPTDSICFRAKIGEIQARARRWITIENGEKFEKHDEPIPRNFWGDREMMEDWSLGDFVSVTYPDGTRFETEAIGVTFDRAGIDTLAPSSMKVKVPFDDLPPMADEPKLGEHPSKAQRGSKLPSLSDASLKRWLHGLSDDERDLPRNILHERCVAAHPNNSISRERVRDALPRLTPGPRVIKPNSSA